MPHDRFRQWNPHTRDDATPVNTTEWIKAHLARMDHSETRQVDRARVKSAESLVVTGPETGLSGRAVAGRCATAAPPLQLSGYRCARNRA